MFSTLGKIVLYGTFLLVFVHGQLVCAEQILSNPELQKIDSKGIPAEWLFYPWGQERQINTLPANKSESGLYVSQKGFIDGGIRIFQKVSLVERKRYRAELTLKTQGDLRILVRFLIGGHEFNETIHPKNNSETQNIQVELIAPGSGMGDFAIDIYGDGEIWLEKVTLQPIAPIAEKEFSLQTEK